MKILPVMLYFADEAKFCQIWHFAFLFDFTLLPLFVFFSFPVSSAYLVFSSIWSHLGLIFQSCLNEFGD